MGSFSVCRHSGNSKCFIPGISLVTLVCTSLVRKVHLKENTYTSSFLDDFTNDSLVYS